MQKPKLVMLYGHVSWLKQSHKNNVAVRNDCWDMETPLQQRVWSFGDHSTASAAAFSGERVVQEPITQCQAVAVPVPTWDGQLRLSEHKDSRLLPRLGAFPQPSAAATHILPPNAAPHNNQASKHGT